MIEETGDDGKTSRKRETRSREVTRHRCRRLGKKPVTLRIGLAEGGLEVGLAGCGKSDTGKGTTELSKSKDFTWLFVVTFFLSTFWGDFVTRGKKFWLCPKRGPQPFQILVILMSADTCELGLSG